MKLQQFLEASVDGIGPYPLLVKTKKEWEKIAKEKIEVEEIKGTIYGFGSELATLRIFMKYTNKGKNNPSSKFDADYSSNMKKFYFRMEK